MIIVYIILLFIASLLVMLLLGFIDLIYSLITGKSSNMAEKFGEAMEAIIGLIGAAVGIIGIPFVILCILAAIVIAVIG